MSNTYSNRNKHHSPYYIVNTNACDVNMLSQKYDEGNLFTCIAETQ